MTEDGIKLSDLSSLRNFIHLSPSEEVALLHILENGSAYAYDLAFHPSQKYKLVGNTMVEKKWIFKTEKTANTALNTLDKRRLLKKKVEKHRDGGTKGRDRKYYYLTLSGLFVGLSILDESKSLNEKIDSIVERWEGLLHPFFGYWKQFEKAGLHDCVVSLLKHSILNWSLEFYSGCIPALFDKTRNGKWKGEVNVNPDFDPDSFLKNMAYTLIINPFGRGFGYLGCGLDDCSTFQHPKSHSIGCLVENDEILHLCPELLKIYQESSKHMEKTTKRNLKHYAIKRQIGDMLGKPDVDWLEIKRLERLIAEYRCLTPTYYTR